MVGAFNAAFALVIYQIPLEQYSVIHLYIFLAYDLDENLLSDYPVILLANSIFCLLFAIHGSTCARCLVSLFGATPCLVMPYLIA